MMRDDKELAGTMRGYDDYFSNKYLISKFKVNF